MDAAGSGHLPFSLGKEKKCHFHYQHYMYHSRECPVTVEALQNTVSATYIV